MPRSSYRTLAVVSGVAMCAALIACKSDPARDRAEAPPPMTADAASRSAVTDTRLRELAEAGDRAGLVAAMVGVSAERAAAIVSELLVHTSNEAAPALILDVAQEVNGSTDGILWMHRGVLAVLASDFDAARAHHQRAVDAPRPEPRSYTSLASLLLRAGRPQEALALAVQARTALPDDPLGFTTYLYALKATRQAQRALEELASHGGMLADEQRGQLRAQLEAPDDLPVVFVDRFPVGARQAMEQGTAAYRRGEHELAIGYWRRALRLDPLDEEVGAELGATLSELGRDAEALIVYEGFAERQSFTLLCMNHGNTLLRLERLKEAAAAYERCLAILPTWTDPRVNLASVLMALGQLDKADAQLRTLAEHGVDPGVQAALTEQLAHYRAARPPATR